MLGIGTYSEQYLSSKGLFMFDPIPQEQWLTAQDVAGLLPDITYHRVIQILRDLRAEYASIEPLPYKKIGRSWIYHPDFVQAAAKREKTPGVKSKKTNKD